MTASPPFPPPPFLPPPPPRPLPLLVVGATLSPPPSLLPPLPNFDNQINWKVFLGPGGGGGRAKPKERKLTEQQGEVRLPIDLCAGGSSACQEKIGEFRAQKGFSLLRSEN